MLYGRYRRLAEDGLIRHERIVKRTAPLAAAAYTGEIAFGPRRADEIMRVLRVQAFVLADDNTTARTLDTASLRYRMDPFYDLIPQGDNDRRELMMAAASDNLAAAVVDAPLLFDDLLVSVAASAARLTYEHGGGGLLIEKPVNQIDAPEAGIRFRYTRTALLNEIDTPVLLVHYLIADKNGVPLG